MNTIKLLKSIILLIELLPYSSTSKEEVLDQLNIFTYHTQFLGFVRKMVELTRIKHMQTVKLV